MNVHVGFGVESLVQTEHGGAAPPQGDEIVLNRRLADQLSEGSRPGSAAVQAGDSGPLVLCLHGIGSSSAAFAPQFAALSGSYRMVAWDAPGYAKSADPKVYLPFVSKTDYEGVTARIQFDKNGDLKVPQMTLSVYKDGKKTPLD